jgi:hypothetical protein
MTTGRINQVAALNGGKGEEGQNPPTPPPPELSVFRGQSHEGTRSCQGERTHAESERRSMVGTPRQQTILPCRLRETGQEGQKGQKGNTQRFKALLNPVTSTIQRFGDDASKPRQRQTNAGHAPHYITPAGRAVAPASHNHTQTTQRWGAVTAGLAQAMINACTPCRNTSSSSVAGLARYIAQAAPRPRGSRHESKR